MKYWPQEFHHPLTFLLYCFLCTWFVFFFQQNFLITYQKKKKKLFGWLSYLLPLFAGWKLWRGLQQRFYWAWWKASYRIGSQNCGDICPCPYFQVVCLMLNYFFFTNNEKLYYCFYESSIGGDPLLRWNRIANSKYLKFFLVSYTLAILFLIMRVLFCSIHFCCPFYFIFNFMF